MVMSSLMYLLYAHRRQISFPKVGKPISTEPDVKKHNKPQNNGEGSKSSEKGGSAEVVWLYRLTGDTMGW